MRSRRSRPPKLLFLLGLSLFVGSLCSAQDREPVDRILAVVEDDPILASEVDQVISFGIAKQEEAEDDRAFRRRILDYLIEERLRFHEVDRFGFAEVPVEIVDEQFQELQTQVGGPDRFVEVMEGLGLDEQGVRQVLARQVMVWVYVEERLGARIFVGLDDIRAYYDEVLVPQLQEGGQPVPPLEEVREAIRTVVREQRINEELERWTIELLQQADIEDYFESNYASLPPVVDAVGAGAD